MKKVNIMEVQFKQFGSGKTYDYFNTLNEVEIGDYVVVDSTRGFGVAEVVGFKDYSHEAKKYVIQRVDVEAHEQRMEAIKRQEELERQMEAREREMEARKKELDKMEKYRKIAENDKKMAKLLAEYEKIKK